MMQFKIYLMDKPQPKQSARFTKSGFSFKPKAVQISEYNLKAQVRTEMEKILGEWNIINKTLQIDYAFIYPFTSTMLNKDKNGLKKKLSLEVIERTQNLHSPNDCLILKPTSPDVDNLMKGINDALQQVAISNDNLVACVSFVKGYGYHPGIHVWIKVIEDMDAIKFLDVNGIDFKLR